MCLNIFIYKCFNILLKNTKYHTNMQIRQCNMHAYEEMLAGYVDPDASYPEADPDSSLFECKLCCKCLRIMSLCYSSIDLAI